MKRGGGGPQVKCLPSTAALQSSGILFPFSLFFKKGSSLAFPAPVANILYSENLEDQNYKEPKENNH